VAIKTCEKYLSWFHLLKELLIKTFVFYVVNFKSVAAFATLTEACFVPPFVKLGLSNLCGIFGREIMVLEYDQMYSNYEIIYICVKSICNKFKISLCYALYDQEVGTHTKHQ